MMIVTPMMMMTALTQISHSLAAQGVLPVSSTLNIDLACRPHGRDANSMFSSTYGAVLLGVCCLERFTASLLAPVLGGGASNAVRDLSFVTYILPQLPSFSSVTLCDDVLFLKCAPLRIKV